jgi:hypothetical protein
LTIDLPPPLILPPAKPAIVRASSLRDLPSWEEMERRLRDPDCAYLFPVFCPASVSASLFSGGTNIGNMTGLGGLAAAFDGTTNKARSSCAYIANATGYVGKTFGTGKRVEHVVAYPSNDNGFQHDNQSGETYSLTLYGKQGTAPSNATNGTSLGTASGSDNSPVAAATITSSDQSTLWDHCWLTITPSPNSDTQCAQLQIYVF